MMILKEDVVKKLVMSQRPFVLSPQAVPKLRGHDGEERPLQIQASTFEQLYRDLRLRWFVCGQHFCNLRQTLG